MQCGMCDQAARSLFIFLCWPVRIGLFFLLPTAIRGRRKSGRVDKRRSGGRVDRISTLEPAGSLEAARRDRRLASCGRQFGRTNAHAKPTNRPNGWTGGRASRRRRSNRVDGRSVECPLMRREPRASGRAGRTGINGMKEARERPKGRRVRGWRSAVCPLSRTPFPHCARARSFRSCWTLQLSPVGFIGCPLTRRAAAEVHEAGGLTGNASPLRFFSSFESAGGE